jgi:hypothetical protein|tara:strand:+ start:1319 stop:1939 length:621 start_codon:yes stop_codon:yes gene_type:complete
MTTKTTSTFDKLYAVDVSAKTEKKNGLTYLSWASAWAEAKKICPSLNYKVYEDILEVSADGVTRTINYFNDGKTAYVKVGVIVDGMEYIEYLPIMDFRHKSISIEKITSWDVGTTIKRCLTKGLALHGLGLKIYEGEDLSVESIQEPIKLNNNKLFNKNSEGWDTMVGWAKGQKSKGKDDKEVIKTITKKHPMSEASKKEFLKQLK